MIKEEEQMIKEEEQRPEKKSRAEQGEAIEHRE